jgi:alkylation response protein AidB-like acyl-CoA dehydrogenase
MAIDLTLGEDQLLLQRSANEFFRKHCPPEFVREIEDGELGYSPDLWREMASLGWLGITYPEEYGGTGAGFLDLYPIYEEMGRFLVPSPHLDTVVVAGDTILAAGTDAQRQRLLPAIASGECIVSLAVVEGDGSFGPAGIACSARRNGGDFVVSGTKLLVGYAPSVDLFLVVARTGGDTGADGISLLLVDAAADGISCTSIPNIAGNPLFAVAFDNVSTPAENLVGELDGGWAAVSVATTKAAVLQTATIVGAAQAVLDMTNQYAKDREQFGGPIGRYQAVQYLVTDILIDMHRADVLAKQAAFRIDAGRSYAREAAIAIAFGKKAAAHLHRQAHEVHAGVAFIVEHDLTLYSRRSKFWENNLGDARYYQEELANAMQRVAASAALRGVRRRARASRSSSSGRGRPLRA